MINFKTLSMSVLLSLITFNGYTDDAPITDIMQKINADMRETRKNAGFNPDGGVTVTPSSEIHAPSNVKSQWVKERLEQRKNGYLSVYNDRAKELLQLGDILQFKYNASLKNKDKNSSIFRKTNSEINMGYTFTPVPEHYVSNVYGFASCNTFKDGWTGIVEFFKSEGVGNCAFTENNVSLTHQAAKVDESIVRYDINEKITVVSVEGNKDSGYLYKVDWFDKDFFRTLECASMDYSVDETNAVINLATKIDMK